MLASRLSTLASCSLVLSLQQNFDHEQVEEVGLLAVKLVIGLVVGASSQLGSLSTRTILRQEQAKLSGQIGLYWKETSEMNGFFDGFVLNVVVYLADKPSSH